MVEEMESSDDKQQVTALNDEIERMESCKHMNDEEEHMEDENVCNMNDDSSDDNEMPDAGWFQELDFETETEGNADFDLERIT
jgi:hypothetical protein